MPLTCATARPGVVTFSKEDWSLSVRNYRGSKVYTSYYTVQAVIDPRDTRANIVRSLRASANKRETSLERRRYVKPA